MKKHTLIIMILIFFISTGIAAETIPKMSDTAAMILKQKRAEIFKEMGWEEGKYANEKEKEIAEKFTDYKDKYREAYVMYYSLMPINKGDTIFVRPLVEFIFNPRNRVESRSEAINKLGYIGDSSAIPVLKKFINDEDSRVRKAAIQSLYYCGDKKTAFEQMVKLNKKGIPFVIYILKNNQPYYDKEAKPYLIEISKIDNDQSKLLAAQYLFMIGENVISENIVRRINNKLNNGEYETNKEKKEIIIRGLEFYQKLKEFKKLGYYNEK